MKTTVMFVADTVPLGGVPVCLVGGGDEVYVTDDEGKIEFDLDYGGHTFRVQLEDEWIERTVNRQGHSSLFVVNVQKNDVASMGTLNTLQIDLAGLVGDRYVFETVLGRGGMGVVVKAIDRMLNRPVAVKMLSDELRENEEAQQIFLVEARNLATLSHPNLVAIHDILNVGGRVLMVFEYVLGENVEVLIKREGAIEQMDVLRIAIQLTRCVAYLHEHELIHRDLKPANVIMQADGTLKLIDFGLARSLNDLYVRGTRVRGTPAYMAPEQIQGIHLTVATDIYQLGISVYEMLNGALPFTSGDMAYAHVHVEPPPLLGKVPELDPELARLIHACLAKQPKDRPASAAVLLEHLQQIYARLASGEPAAPEEPITAPLAALPPTLHVSDSDFTIADAPFVDDVSFADEVVGGSNRGLAMMALVGVGLFTIAALVMFAGRDEPATPTEPVPVAAAKPVAVPPPPVVEKVELSGPLLAARGLVGLGVATANGQASGIAAAAQTNTPRRARRKVVAQKVRPTERRKSSPAPEPDPVVTEPVEPKTEPVEPKTEPKEVEPKTSKPAKKGGLLSVSDGKSKSLLPVSD